VHGISMDIERRDDGDIPDYGRGVGEEELAMRVEDSETPRGEHQKADTGEEDADKLDGEVAGSPSETWGDERDEDRSKDDSEGDEDRSGESEQSEDGFSELGGFFVALLGAEARVNRDEGC